MCIPLYQQVAQIGPALRQVEQALSDLIARRLATLTDLGTTERLVAAIIAELVGIKERLTRLEPPPPTTPPRQCGRPRKELPF